MGQQVDTAALLPLIADGVSGKYASRRGRIPVRRHSTKQTPRGGEEDLLSGKRVDQERLLEIVEAVSGAVSARLRSTLLKGPGE